VGFKGHAAAGMIDGRHLDLGLHAQHAAFAVILDRRANAKVVTMQTSSTNGILSALHALGSVAPFEARDLSGTMIVAATRAKIKKLPAVARGKEVGQLEWEIELFDAVWAHATAGAV
jgi:hypothetical protein